MRGRGTIFKRIVTCALASAALMVAGVASAYAAPTESVMGLSELQSKLEANGGAPLHGYFKTVVKGSAISILPLDVLGITAGITPDQSLILFEAPDLASSGGVAEGMSGSPVYVDNKIVGAISYGDMFSLRGTGLATPIEYMTALEGSDSLRTQSLKEPVLAGTTVIDRIVFANGASKHSKPQAAGTMVAKPLTQVVISGVNPSSTAYKRLASAFSARGISLSAQTSAGGEAIVNGVPFSAPLVGGASVADMLVRGDLWGGGIGTVTYSNGNNVVAFGHGAFGLTNTYLSNAYIDGIMPNSLITYKTGRPGVVRGRITQDTMNGIGGVVGADSDETTLKGHATNAETGKTATATSYAVPAAINWYGGSIAGAAASLAGSRLSGWAPKAGSAETTTTVHLRCDDMARTITVTNVMDSRYDVASATGDDAYRIVNAIGGLQAYGLDSPVIESVDVESRISSQSRDAQIADIHVAGALKSGDNKVTVSLVSWGVAATRTVETTLTIPEGTPLDGQITASCTQGRSMNFDPYFYQGDAGGKLVTIGGGAVKRPRLEDVLNDIDEVNANNVLTLSYQPVGDTETPEVSSSIIATATTPWALNGEVAKSTTQLSLRTRSVGYGGVATAEGNITCGDESGVLSFWGTAAGDTTETLLAQISSQTTGPYFAVLGPLQKNTKVRAVFSGSDYFLNAQATKTSGVYAKLRMSSSTSSIVRGRSVTLSVSAMPSDIAGGKVVFQRYNSSRHRWVAIGTRTLTRSGSVARARIGYRPSATAKVRARFLGGKTNVATNSSSITVRVK